jgi:L-threonylcarbamoyladenylate synthase
MLISMQQSPKRAIQVGADYLRRGKLVAFPTETVYGLGANVWNPAAVAAIFQAKSRPADNPLIAHISSWDMLEQLVSTVPPAAIRLMQAFWPGPLSIVLPRSPKVPDIVTAGLPTVAVRWPNHPVALALISTAGLPVAAPSANRSGRPSPTLAEHVQSDLGDQVDLIIDAGMAAVGLESTVVNLSGDSPVLLRPGAVTLEELQQVIGPLQVAGRMESGAAPSPGMKYRHYAPAAPLHLYLGESSDSVSAIRRRASELLADGRQVGVLTYDQYVDKFAGATVLSLGSESQPAEAAQRLYSRLREFDALGVEVILAQGLPTTAGLALALQNRLSKAAGHRIIWTSM